MNDLLELAIEAHGGLDLWQGLSRITVDKSIGGSLFALKDQPEALRNTTISIDPHRPYATYSPIALPNMRAVYDGDTEISIRTAEGKILERRPLPRPTFLALPHDYPWDMLHLTYFCGYAGWNYLTAPFIFTRSGFTTREIEPWEEEGEIWRRLHVIFSPDIPTHCPEQTFYFDGRGVLRRLDYQTEFSGAMPTAHYLYDHRKFSGLLMPTRRLAFPRLPDGKAAPAPVFVELHYSNFILE